MWADQANSEVESETEEEYDENDMDEIFEVDDNDVPKRRRSDDDDDENPLESSGIYDLSNLYSWYSLLQWFDDFSNSRQLDVIFDYVAKILKPLQWGISWTVGKFISSSMTYHFRKVLSKILRACEQSLSNNTTAVMRLQSKSELLTTCSSFAQVLSLSLMKSYFYPSLKNSRSPNNVLSVP